MAHILKGVMPRHAKHLSVSTLSLVRHDIYVSVRFVTPLGTDKYQAFIGALEILRKGNIGFVIFQSHKENECLVYTKSFFKNYNVTEHTHTHGHWYNFPHINVT